MGTSGHVGACPYCGAARDGAGDGSPAQRRQALEALSREVARIRELAEGSSAQPAVQEYQKVIAAQARQIRLLRETVARLRGASQASASQASGPGRPGAGGTSGTARSRGRAPAAGVPPVIAEHGGQRAARGTLAGI
jgi:hypothetical protein